MAYNVLASVFVFQRIAGVDMIMDALLIVISVNLGWFQKDVMAITLDLIFDVCGDNIMKPTVSTTTCLWKN